MGLDRVLPTDAAVISTHQSGTPVITASAILPPPGSGEIPPSVSTPLLRQCTALAAKARVELLSRSRHSAADELTEVLAQIESWEPAAVADPDPTMLVLAAAALQDLDSRLPESAMPALGAGVQRVLERLRAVMAASKLAAIA